MRVGRWIAGMAAVAICAGGLSHVTSDAADSSARPTQAALNEDSTRGMSQPSKEIVRDRVQREVKQINESAETRPDKDAADAVKETEKAVELLDKNQVENAQATLDRALGKAGDARSSHPNATLVPVSTLVAIVDRGTDEATMARVTGEVRDLVKQGRYQAARLLMRNVGSEIDVTSINIPVETYPTALRAAAELIDRGDVPGARERLIAALHMQVVTEKAIPLPVIRAQALVDEVERQSTQRELDAKQAIRMLDDAEQQLALAARLGYGTRKEDFAPIQDSIRDAKAMVDRDQQPKTVLARVRDDLRELRQKLSRSSNAPT